MAIIKFCLSLIALGIVNVDGRLQGNANSKTACEVSQMGYKLFVPFDGEGCDVKCVDGLQEKFISAEAFEIAASSQFQAVYSNDLCSCLPLEANKLEFELSFVSFSSKKHCTPSQCWFEYRGLKNTEQAYYTSNVILLEQRGVGMDSRSNYKLACVSCEDTPDSLACAKGEPTVKMPRVSFVGYFMIEYLKFKNKVSPKGERSLMYYLHNVEKRDQLTGTRDNYQPPVVKTTSPEVEQPKNDAPASFTEEATASDNKKTTESEDVAKVRPIDAGNVEPKINENQIKKPKTILQVILDLIKAAIIKQQDATEVLTGLQNQIETVEASFPGN